MQLHVHLYLTLVGLLALVALSHEEDMRLPPSITKQNEEKVITYITEGTALLECEASGSPQPKYKWLKNGLELSLNAHNIQSDSVTGTIQISPLYSLDEGYYQCIAYNLHGTALSNVIHLQQAVLGNFQNPDTVQDYTIQKGTHVAIPCQAPKSVPPATFTWQRVESATDKYPIDIRLDRRISIDTSGKLYFSHVSPEDQYLYQCSAYNPEKKVTTHGSLSRLHVISGDSAVPFQPTIQFYTQSPENVALLGTTAVLICIFAAYPTAEPIIWNRQGGTLPSGRYEFGETRSYLIIRSVQLSDEGVYTCTTSNSAGTATQDISLKVESLPTFTSSDDQLTNINKTDGDSVRMECIANAKPSVDISWFVNGKPLNVGELGARYKLSPNNTVLTIDNVCKDCASGSSDLKVFSCNASNVHGYSYISGYLNVLLPTVITKGPTPMELAYGKLVRFHCEASSDDSTPVEINWLRDSEPIIYQSGRMQKDSNNSLVIFANKEADSGVSFAGEYTCFANNGYSSQTSTPVALTLPPGPAPVTGADLSSLWWVFLIIAIIVLLLLLLLICCLCRQRMKGDTYPVDEKEVANGNNPILELADNYYQEYQRPEHQGQMSSSHDADNDTHTDETKVPLIR